MKKIEEKVIETYRCQEHGVIFLVKAEHEKNGNCSCDPDFLIRKNVVSMTHSIYEQLGMINEIHQTDAVMKERFRNTMSYMEKYNY